MVNYAFVDSEINGKKQITDLGGVKSSGEEFHRNNPKEFKTFLRDANFIVGHNIVHHDALYIGKFFPMGATLIDTLYLSPLLFPNKPYHKLVKDDKILTEDVNNPLSDSKKCRDLYYDEVAKFESLPAEIKDIYGELLYRKPEFSGFLKSVGWRHHIFANIKAMVLASFRSFICSNSDLDRIIKETPVELAYALALITAEDKKSITPGWVLHTFPKVQNIMEKLRSTNCHDDHCPYCTAVFQAKSKLKEYFGYSEFRTFDGENLQEKAVELALEGESLLAVFPTGGGKSLTFQLPALIANETERGLTVVISPLQSLMKDQVDNLEAKHIVGAATINGLLNPIERQENIELIRNGTASILYIAPESLRSRSIEKLLLSRKISRFVIDEAHCFSSWGQDFRVDYLFIANFIKRLQERKQLEKNIPVSCFTATAKPKVISDICAYFRNNLGIELKILASSAARTNLKYKVLYQENNSEKYLTLRELLHAKNCPTIVYVSRVKETLQLAEKLSQDGIPAVAFNGQMDRNEKVINQNRFMSNEVQVIVATSAFGMGVDKSDVKLVVHYDISDSLENYVQEAGRAGRDQSIEAECYVLYNEGELDKHFLLLNQTKITINEIQQVWRAIKSMTSKNRPTVSASALEIARRAGWDDNIHDIETRVRTALSALEQAGYIIRNMNSPRVFATGVLVKSFSEAASKIEKSLLFCDDSEKRDAKRIIQSIISARATAEMTDDAESRVDYLSDNLGLQRLYVEELISKMRQEKILADSVDMNAYLKTGEETKITNVIVRFANLERYLLEHVFDYEGRFGLKELNERAQEEGIKDATVKNIRTILFYWQLKGLIKCSCINNICTIALCMNENDIRLIVEKKLNLAGRIAAHLFSLKGTVSQDERLIQFSLLSLMDALKTKGSLIESDLVFNEKEVRDALLYLTKIDALKIDGGFIILYNSLNVERIVTDNHIQYKREDYKDLENFYKMKTQQIHIVGEYANMMLKSYDDALTYVKDYFTLDYEVFLKKYFKGRQRTGEIMRNITPEKYKQLFGALSPIQRQIIDDDQSQYICVIAGPGSGKTRVLVHKLASLLLLEDVKSEQLLMLTFSRMAAREFKSRLASLVGTAVGYVDIKTFHSYCFDLLGKVGNEDEFGDVVKTATKMIANGEVEESKIAKTVLVIDEAQDIDEDEYNLIKALIDRTPDLKVIAVGDDDQNIYEFRGADSKYLNSLVTEFGATKYEMVENYRSKKRIIGLANLYARTIRNRIKVSDIVSMKQEDGNVLITEHVGENLEIPVCNDYLSRKLPGTTAILTITNEAALKVVGILTKKGIDAKLIQSDDNINLYNLAEFRFFIDSISANDSPIVDEKTWGDAKNGLRAKYQKSNILDKVINIIEVFEKENPKRYKNDFVSFLCESSFADFENYESATVVVSTIHKAKGREFENVYLLLDKKTGNDDDEKRRVYVGMTRAKSNLLIHVCGKAFEKTVGKLPVKYRVDANEYPEPDDIEIQLGYRDVFLGLFKDCQSTIQSLYPGYGLRNSTKRLTVYGAAVVQYSMAFYERTLSPIINKGYQVIKSEVRYLAYWKDLDKPKEKEVLIVLPNIYLIRTAKTDEGEKIIEPDPEKKTEESKEEVTAKPSPVKEKTKYDYSSEIFQKSYSELTTTDVNEIKKTPLFRALRAFRAEIAAQQNVPVYTIMNDRTAVEIVLKRPTTQAQLLGVHGFGVIKYIQYGERILALIEEYL